MDVPVEYIILAAVAAALILILIIMLCVLCCRQSHGATEDTEVETVGTMYVPAKEPDASDYNRPNEREMDEREASATVLMDAGYTGTQLVRHGIVREATKTELLETGFTKSQLREADILPAEKTQRKKADRKTDAKSPKLGFKSKPLKPFDSNLEVDKRTKGKKRAADSDDDEEQEVAVRKKKSIPKEEENDQFEGFFAEDKRQKSPPPPPKRVRQKSEERKNTRITIKDSNEKIPDRKRKDSGKDQGFQHNLTTLF